MFHFSDSTTGRACVYAYMHSCCSSCGGALAQRPWLWHRRCARHRHACPPRLRLCRALAGPSVGSCSPPSSSRSWGESLWSLVVSSPEAVQKGRRHEAALSQRLPPVACCPLPLGAAGFPAASAWDQQPLSSPLLVSHSPSGPCSWRRPLCPPL